jgi:hypothetical protein
LMKEAPGSSETTVLTRATRRNNPEDTILDCISYIIIIQFHLLPHNVIICNASLK